MREYENCPKYLPRVNVPYIAKEDNGIKCISTDAHMDCDARCDKCSIGRSNKKWTIEEIEKAIAKRRARVMNDINYFISIQ